jgi:hypothetical protein
VPTLSGDQPSGCADRVDAVLRHAAVRSLPGDPDRREDIALLRAEDRQFARLGDDRGVCCDQALSQQHGAPQLPTGLLIRHDVRNHGAPGKSVPLTGQQTQGDKHGGHPGLHVTRAAAVHAAVLDLGRKRIACPPLADRNRVNVARQHDGRPRPAGVDPGDKDRPVRRSTGLGDRDAGNRSEVIANNSLDGRLVARWIR